MLGNFQVTRVFGTVPAEISLEIADHSVQKIPAGNYVAVRQTAQQPGAYQLYKVDTNGNQTRGSVATVYLAIRSDGDFEIV